MRTEAGTRQSSHKPSVPGTPGIQKRQEDPPLEPLEGAWPPGVCSGHPPTPQLQTSGLSGDDSCCFMPPCLWAFVSGPWDIHTLWLLLSPPPWRSLSPFCRRCVVPCKKQGTRGLGELLPAPRFSDPCFSNGICHPPPHQSQP